MKLPPAIALGRAEYVARQALRVYARERRHLRVHLALVERDELLAARLRAVARDAELADLRRQTGRRHALDRQNLPRPRAVNCRFFFQLENSSNVRRVRACRHRAIKFDSVRRGFSRGAFALIIGERRARDKERQKKGNKDSTSLISKTAGFSSVTDEKSAVFPSYLLPFAFLLLPFLVARALLSYNQGKRPARKSAPH